MNRCVNLDWLEVFARERDGGATPEYFLQRGYKVKVREYGTPNYRQMFTIYDGDFPYIEIRRDPYSLKSNGGIFEPDQCHIRLANRTCYMESPINRLRAFMLANNFDYISLSRVDICLDFNYFDSGERPDYVLKSYLEGKISKINQCRIAAYGSSNIKVHGKDKWEERVWNSISWGSKKSPISTKFYDKSLELRESKDKFYIRDTWEAAGLRDDESVHVWRVEFSVKSDYKHFVNIDDGELIPNDLTQYDDREKLLFRFHSFAARYFHFKYHEDGKRKDRCRDKKLFMISQNEKVYKPIKLTQETEPTRTDKIIAKRLQEIIRDEKISRETREAAKDMLVYFTFTKRMARYEEASNALILSSE